MDNEIPLYNSRIIKLFLNYLRNAYPEIDTDAILAYADITKFEVEDQGHWFTQRQVDRFYECVASTTRNPNIAREAGRAIAVTSDMGAAKQYTLGFLNLATVYMLMDRLMPIFTRGAAIKTRKLGPNRILITATPKPGVEEKPYQCENRMGAFESISRLFSLKLATVEHPQCFHRGASSCRYLISWEWTPAQTWKRFRNYSCLAALLITATAAWMLPAAQAAVIGLSAALITAFIFYHGEKLEKQELSSALKGQGDAAKDLVDAMNLRHNHAMLVQEIGQATSTIVDSRKLIRTVLEIMRRRLDFDRGMIMLASSDRKRLLFADGYAIDPEHIDLMRKTSFRLDNPDSRGIFVLAFKDQKPYLMSNFEAVKSDLSPRSREFAARIQARSFICVPLVYKKSSLGILTVDNLASKRQLTQSDMSLLMGVASQTAVSIVNARSFERLQESEKKYRDLVENANSIILRRDIEGNITFFNEFAQKFFGYSEAEILGRNIRGTIHEDGGDLAQQLEELNQVLVKDPEQPVTREYAHRLRNGETLWVAWTYKPIFDQRGKIREILCIGNDISNLKRAHSEKKALEGQLQRAQKMEALGTLAGGVAHDLNNILSGIISYPELLLLDLPEDSPYRKPILSIQKSGEKAAAIVQDLLTLARRGVSNWEVLNLNQIISEYFQSPEYQSLEMNHPHMTLELNLDSSLLPILGSGVHLSKTVMNLISNAAEALVKKGKIVVGTQNRYVDRPVRGYDEVLEGDYVTLAVADNGIGIPPEDLDRIFEPFYTKKVMGKSGTGLGMAVVWGTVRDHRGYIDVQSVVGRGTVFTLYFPVTEKRPTANGPAVGPEALMGRGESILVIDDIKAQRDIATHILTRLGYKVSAVASGQEAVEYLRTRQVELLILDMIMNSGMDGLETYQRILEIRPGQKAIIVSGFSESERVREAQRLGAGAYVKKPYLMRTIGAAVREALQG